MNTAFTYAIMNVLDPFGLIMALVLVRLWGFRLGLISTGIGVAIALDHKQTR